MSNASKPSLCKYYPLGKNKFAYIKTINGCKSLCISEYENKTNALRPTNTISLDFKTMKRLLYVYTVLKKQKL